MVVALVQSVATGNSGPDTGGNPATLPAPPTAGNILILDLGQRLQDASTLNIPAGWTTLGSNDFAVVDSRGHLFLGKVSNGTEQTVTFTAGGEPESSLYTEWSGFGGVLPAVIAVGTADETSATPTFPTITTTAGRQLLILASQWKKGAAPNPGPQTLTGYTVGPDTGYAGFGNRHRLTCWYRIVTPSASSYPAIALSSSGNVDDANLIHLALDAGAADIAPVVDVVDPGGVSLVTFTNLLEHRERVEYNGTGSGYLVINRHDAQATATNLAKGNVVRITHPEIHSTACFEWIMEDGDFDLVSSDEEGGEDLTFSGRGTLALLENAILGHQNLTDPPRNYNSEGVWRWTSEEWAGIFRRTIQEAQAHTPPALTMITRDWSDTVDSKGNAFFDMDGDWEIPIGADLLTIGLDLARAGMGSIEMRPGFLLRAYEGTNQGRDLSGAFGAATVRFEAGVNITTEVSREMESRRWASNVLIHTKDGYLWYSTTIGGDITGTAATDTVTSSTAHGLEVNDAVMFKVLNGGAGLAVSSRYFVQAVPSTTTFKLSLTRGGAVIDFTTNITTGSRIIEAPYIKEVLLDLSGATGTNTQERAAARRLLRGEEAVEGVIFEASPVSPAGLTNTPASGWYYPGYQGTDNGKYWVGDLVTFHTGSVAGVDFVAKTMRIQAITLGRDEAGQFAPPIIELNSPWGATTEGSSVPSGSSSAAGSGSAGGGVTQPHVHTQYQPTADKGVTSGYASLDTDGRVPAAQLRSWKEPVRVATTANGVLATAFENGDTIDGVVLATGDRILLKDQTAGAENGIYIVAATGAPTRAADFDASGEVVGTLVAVVAGTVAAGSVYRVTNLVAPTIGTTAILFTKFGSGVVGVRFPIAVIFDGGGSAITGNPEVDVVVPAAGTLISWTLLADIAGSAVVDIWKDTYANYPPVAADTITAAAKPTLSAADKGQNSTLTGWITSLAAGDVLRFRLDSSATVRRLGLTLIYERT